MTTQRLLKLCLLSITLLLLLVISGTAQAAAAITGCIRTSDGQQFDLSTNKRSRILFPEGSTQNGNQILVTRQLPTTGMKVRQSAKERRERDVKGQVK